MSNILDRKGFKYQHSSTHLRVEPFQARLIAARQRISIERYSRVVLRYARPELVAEVVEAYGEGVETV